MSGKSGSPDHTRGTETPPVLRPEALRLLDCAGAAFHKLDPAAKRLGNDAGFRADTGYTVFRVQPVNETTHTGLHIAERLMLHTTLPAGTPLSDADLVKANLMAGIGAVVRKPETGELAILTAACVPAGDDHTLNVLGELPLRRAEVAQRWVVNWWEQGLSQNLNQVPGFLGFPCGWLPVGWSHG